MCPANSPAAQFCQSRRGYASAEPDLKETLKGLIPAKRELLKKVKAVGDKKLGDCKVENALGGMRYGP
jgi:citrate synthase